jgi:YgiT-type zinc finger domain-containing protein
MARARRTDLAAVTEQWESLAAEVLVGIKDWRSQHPRATFTEIEDELDRELGRLRSRLLEDVVLASAATEGVPTAGAAGAPTGCPACGGALRVRGQATRAVTVTRDQTVTLARAYTVCSACGAGVFPPG